MWNQTGFELHVFLVWEVKYNLSCFLEHSAEHFALVLGHQIGSHSIISRNLSNFYLPLIVFNGNTSIFWRVLRSLRLNGQVFEEQHSPTSSPDVSQPELCLEPRIFHLDIFFFPGIYWKYDVCVLSVWQSKTQEAWVQVNLTIKPHSLACSVPLTAAFTFLPGEKVAFSWYGFNLSS